MVPAARANAGGVAKATLDFVSERDCRDKLSPIRTDTLGDRERSRNIVARMRRFLRQISVVVIEVADATAIRKRRPVRRRLVSSAKDCRSLFGRKIRSDFSRNRTWLFLPCSQRAAQRINDAPFDFVHNVFGKIFVSQRARVIGELMGKRFLHEREISICR